jgi:2-methylcitrate dehydratase PrpD
MALDQEVDTAYPVRWIGKVTVQTLDGRSLQGRVDEPKGDPGNTLTRAELEKKALSLADFGGAATSAEMQTAFKRLWSITEAQQVGMLLMQS